jgi:hypothetical protein
MSSQTVALPARVQRAAGWVVAARDRLVAVRPLYVLSTLIAVQWAAVLALALTVRHNGWVYYAGGDQLWHYTGAHLIAHGHLPPTYVGYGWSFLLLPVAGVAGPNLVSALPAIVLLDTLVLLPVALLGIYGIGARIAGRLFGYWAAVLWIAIPYLGSAFVEPGYHQKWTELTLPQFVGLTPGADFPSTVALIVSAYFCLRVLDSHRWHDAAAGGLAAGYSIAIKPSNAIFLIVPAVVLIALRWRAAIAFAAALAPSLLILGLWKYRGLGELAAAPSESVRVAAGIDSLLHRIHNPQTNSWSHLHDVLLALREHFWISRVLEWLPVAGAVALLLRSRRGFVLVVAWFATYLLIKGTYVPASIDDTSFFRIVMPGFPAFVLLCAAVVLLVPGVRARPHALERGRPSGRRYTVALATAGAVFVVAPLAVVAAVPPLHDSGSEAMRVNASEVPVSSHVTPTASLDGSKVRLAWKSDKPAPGAVFYTVLRTKGANAGVGCAGRLNGAADDCRLYAEAPAATAATSYVDEPGAGTWTYRIGVSANWLDDFKLGDVYVVGKPVTVTVP